MKILRGVAVLALVLAGLLLMSSSARADGKSLFLSSKCISCHSVTSQGIAKAPDAEKVTDLSKVGADKKAPWLKNYLLKKEQLKGKAHKKAWKGSDADLDTLANWLATLK